MGASAGAIRAGQAFVELFVKDEIAKGLATAQRTLKSWGNSLSSVGSDLMAGGAAVLAPMTAAVKMFSDAGFELDTLSKKTGMSVEWLGALQYAVGQLGGDFEGFDVGIKKMQKTVADAARGVQPSVDAIERLGLSVQQVAAMTPERQLMTIGDALSRIQDPAQRAASAVEIFGRTGTNLLPAFSQGAAGVEKLMARGRELGVVMSTQMARDAANLHYQMAEVWAVMTSAGNAIAEALVPTLKELGDTISRGVQWFRQWASAHQEAVQWAFKLAAATVAVGGALVVASVPLRAVAGIMAGLRAITIATTAAVTGFRVAMAAASAHPIIAVLTVIAGIVAAIATNFLLAKKASQDFASSISDLNVFQPPDVAVAKRTMDSLQGLSAKGPLDAAGMKEAKERIDDLKVYDLGITVDETTGSINGMSEAWDKFAAAAKDRTLEDLDSQLAEVGRKIEGVRGKAVWKENFMGGGVSPGNEAAKEMQRMEAMRARLLAARKGIEDADAGTLAGKPLAGGEAFDKSSTREIEREIAKEKLQQLQGGVEKELKELDLEQAERVAKAKEVGADLTKIEELFQEKRRTVIQKYADERSKIADEEAKKRMEDGARWEEEMNRQAQSVQEAQSGAIFDLKKLYIEATKEGKDKELALLEVERDEALKKAFEEGVPQEYVDAAFEIKKAMVEAADAGERQKSAAVGMFSPARLEALGILDEPIRQTAKAAEKISETTRKMLDELILQRQWNCFE